MQVLSNIADLRKATNLTQIELATRAGISQSSLAKVERGAPTSMRTAQVLASLLKVSLDVVLWSATVTSDEVRIGYSFQEYGN